METFADLYKLKPEDLVDLEKFGAKSADNLVRSLEASKSNELWRLIHGLGILNVGAQSAKDIAAHFGSLDDLAEASEEDLLAIDGIGPIVAGSITDYFQHKPHLAIIDELRAQGLQFKGPKKPQGPQPLAGTTWVLTGTLRAMTRDEAKALIEAAGGKTSNSVSKKTTYLLAGESAGSKLEKAKTLGVEVLSEEAFKQKL